MKTGIEINNFDSPLPKPILKRTNNPESSESTTKSKPRNPGTPYRTTREPNGFFVSINLLFSMLYKSQS